MHPVISEASKAVSKIFEQVKTIKTLITLTKQFRLILLLMSYWVCFFFFKYTCYYVADRYDGHSAYGVLEVNFM